jgi:phage recombination protein Bet
MTAVATVDDSKLIQVLQNSLYPGAQKSSVEMVLSYCHAAKLDPIQKPVHIVPVWDGKAKQMRDVIMPGIGMYRTQAARSGCVGISEPEFGPEFEQKVGAVTIKFPQWCRVTVKRELASGAVAEFSAREFWLENYAMKGGQEKSESPNAMWQKRPYGQLAKCAEAQALRKGFPELGAAPTADEMLGRSLAEVDPFTVDAEPARATVEMPKAKSDAVDAMPRKQAEEKASEGQKMFLRNKAKAKGCTLEEAAAAAGIAALDELSTTGFDVIKEYIAGLPDAA